MKPRVRLTVILVCMACLSCPLSEARSQPSQRERAEQILEACSAKGGLIAVIGCDSPGLLAALRVNDSYLVHGLDSDTGRVASAREYLRDRGAYGGVTVSHLEGSQLPYVDNLVNVIVVAADVGRVVRDEMIRALAPNGVLVDARRKTLDVTRKRWPDELDEWTHYLYDASNNAVSSDTVVAPPRGLQWTCGPEYARSHEHFSSVSAVVSSASRVFYIIDEGPISSVFLAPQWKLVARDAFNGVLLWELPISNWESPLRGFRSGPPEIGRRLIAVGGRVYVALNYGDPVTVLDAATGKRLDVLSETTGARELLLRDGVLYVLADDMTGADHDERTKWISETAPTLTGYMFPKRAIPMYGKQRIIALETESGSSLWTNEYTSAGEILPATLAAVDGSLCFQSVSHVVCLKAADGKERWRKERPVANSRFSWSTPTLVIHDGVVLTVDRVATAQADDAPPRHGSTWIIDSSHQSKKQDAEIVTFSLADGDELWRAPCFENYDTQLDIFVINGVVWLGDLRHKRDAGFTEGRALRTGEIVARLPHNQELYDLQMGHHRCYRNKATLQYLLLGRDGIEFIDLKSGVGSGNWWVRGTCQYGIMPANGLVYAPQHSCACHPAEKLIGFNALSARSCADEQGPGAESLFKGPAYDGTSRSTAGLSKGDWPTYRRDARRSGFQDLPAPRAVDVAWRQKFASPITAPVVAGGHVFFAETERHTLHAVSARDGKSRWTFVADGRIDSPPTIRNGRCVFGTRNGFVYCLRAADGELVWRFRAAGRARLLFSYEQLESPWPIHGSVLIDLENGPPRVYFAAGRSSHLDGGIGLYALELDTGAVVHRANVTMNAPAEPGGVLQQRALPDILSVQGGDLFMRDLRFGKDLTVQEKKLAHLYAPAGLLDDTWWHRTYWVYGTTIMSAYGGWPRVGNVVPAGRLLVLDGSEHIYGYGRMAYRAGAGHVQPDPTQDYKLFAEVREPKPTPKPKKAGSNQKKNVPAGEREIVWSKPMPFVARAIVLAQDALLVAGGKSLTETAQHHGPGTFWVASRKDGAKLGACTLPAPPVLDGMALTDSGVFVSLIDGSVACLRSTQ